MRLEYRLFRIGKAAHLRLRRWPWIIRLPVYLIGGALFLLALLIVGLLEALFGLFIGLRFRLRPPAGKRDVSRSAENRDVDRVEELIDDEGSPLRERQHRLIYRDERLLPKPELPLEGWPRPKRKQLFSAADAGRLFSQTMRSADVRIRDLLADEAQLRRFDLPVWRTEQDLASALGITLGTLRHYSIHRDRERCVHYVAYAVPKRRGGDRTIMAPKRRLKAIHHQLLPLLVDRLPVSTDAHGFHAGRSIASGAAPHVGKAVVLTMDLKAFFRSVTFPRVRGFLIALGYGYSVATTLAVLVTEAERQPVSVGDRRYYVPVTPRYCVQGAPTSPGLCNAICLRMDRRLAGLARKYGWQYTRYADDLAFSGDTVAHLPLIRRLARRICAEEGFEVHPDKTRIMRRGRRQRVTGVTVNEVLGLSRRERRQLRAAIHRLRVGGGEPASLRPEQIAGKLAYLAMLNAEQAEALRAQWEQA